MRQERAKRMFVTKLSTFFGLNKAHKPRSKYLKEHLKQKEVSNSQAKTGNSSGPDRWYSAYNRLDI